MQGRDPLYDNIPGCGVDPRNLAQRVMAVCNTTTLLCMLLLLLTLSQADVGWSLGILLLSCGNAQLLLQFGELFLLSGSSFELSK